MRIFERAFRFRDLAVRVRNSLNIEMKRQKHKSAIAQVRLII